MRKLQIATEGRQKLGEKEKVTVRKKERHENRAREKKYLVAFRPSSNVNVWLALYVKSLFCPLFSPLSFTYLVL